MVGFRVAESKDLLPDWLLGESSKAVVPSLRGMAPDQARALLEARGLLFVAEDQINHPTVTAGTVAAQMPLAQSHASKGSQVKVSLSKGPAVTPIPDLAGLPVASAEQTLVQAGLKIGPSTQMSSDTVPAGHVIGSTPKNGTAATPGAIVSLVISSGASAKVPRLRGMSLWKAKKAITDAGFKVGSIRFFYSEDHDGEIVLRQTPEAGSDAAPGSKINIVVNEI